MFVSKQDRVLNLILIGCNMYLTEKYQRISKINHGDVLESNKNVRNSPACEQWILNYVNFLACILLASDWFKNNQLLSQLTDAHYRDKIPLIVIQLFNFVYLPFNDVSICQAIMLAFHLLMFHYHYHQLFLFRHLISYVCCSFNFNCERFEPRSHFIPVCFDLVSKKLFYHY